MINYVAIGVAVLLNMAIGMAWYSPSLFGSTWAAGIKFKGTPKMGVFHLVQALGVGLIIALGLANLIDQLAIFDVYSAIRGSAIVWLSFVVPTHYSGVIWAQKPMSVYVIDMGYYLVSFCVIGALLAWWR